TGVNAVYARALGAHRSASGSGSSTTTADAGAIGACSGALAYGVTMSSGLVGIAGPPGFTNISTMSDTAIKGDGEYLVQNGASYVIRSGRGSTPRRRRGRGWPPCSHSIPHRALPSTNAT